MSAVTIEPLNMYHATIDLQPFELSVPLTCILTWTNRNCWPLSIRDFSFYTTLSLKRVILSVFKYTFIAVCTYRLMMISIERSEADQRSTLEIWDKFSPRQNAVWDKIQSERNFFELNFVSDCICLRLNFVSDYIPQLYFICNLLILALNLILR